MSGKILLVDDEASLRRSVSLGLLQKGYDTIPCENGMKALAAIDLFSKNQVDLSFAIIDFRLPDIDGAKLLKIIKSKFPSLPVIIITGYGNEVVKGEEMDAFLDKPFSVEDLADLLEKIQKKEGSAKKEEKQVKTEKSVGGYALLRFNKEADMIETYKNLYFMENILYCDATRGDFDIVVFMQCSDKDSLDKLMKDNILSLEGLESCSFINIEKPVLSEVLNEIIGSAEDVLGKGRDEAIESTNRNFRRSASSYVFIEIEKEKLENIYPTLFFNDNVVSCDYTKGCFDFVLLMKGTSFSEIDSIVNNNFKSLDGVLRIKECPIIKLFNI